MSEQILKAILNEIQSMKTEIGTVKSELGSIKTGQSAIEQQLIAFQQFTMDSFSKLDAKVTKTNVIIENEIRPAIKIITEQLDDHSRTLQFHTGQLDRIEDKVTHHDIKISILDKTKSNKRIAKVK